MKRYLLITILAILVSCATTYSPQEQAYLNKISEYGRTASFPKTQEEEVWGRAQYFISKYSTMKIQTLSEYLIETYNSDLATKYAWQANKIVKGDSIEIEVNCWSGNDWFGGSAKNSKRNEQIFIDYLITGELPFTKLISR